MIGNRPMTKEELRLRYNCTRREELKKIKAEGGEAYQKYRKEQKDRRDKRIKRLKTENNGEGYKRLLERQREHGKRFRVKDPKKHRKQQREARRKQIYRLRTENNGEGYKKFLEHRRQVELPKAKKLRQELRQELRSKYLIQRLMLQGYKKEEITDKDIINMQMYILSLCLVKIKTKERKREEYKAGITYREYLKENKLQRCHKCKQVKSYDDFYSFRIQRKGIPQICKECDNELTKQKKQKMYKSYIKALILGPKDTRQIGYADIPDELVEVKRMHLKIRRALAERNQGTVKG